MAYAPDLIVNASTFALIVQRPTSSVRSNTSATLTEPETLTISHETTKLGKVNSVAFLDNFYLVGGSTCDLANTQGRVRAQLKLSYDPINTGDIDLAVEIADVLDNLLAFIGDAGNRSKFINKES